MKIAILSTFDFIGGAFKAAYRLHLGLLEKGIDSKMLVSKKANDDYTILHDTNRARRRFQTIFPFLDSFILKFYKKRKQVLFSPSFVSSSIISRLKKTDNQIVHLHWINNAFLSIRSIKKIKQPIVWTIHDMWIFTGGCHYAGDCKKYISGCFQCPILGSKKKNDLSRRMFNRKLKYWKNLNLTIVSPSKWLAACAQESLLLKNARIEIVPNPINTNIYKPIDKVVSRTIMNLPIGKSIILFGATNSIGDERKGIKYLLSALNNIPIEKRENLLIVIFGSTRPQNPIFEKFNIFYFGELKDEQSLAVLYSCADVFIAPSLEDNLPLTVMESLACGIPVVAFNIGGMPDMIDHKLNGYLATPFDSADLAIGLNWILENPERRISLGRNARNKVLENYTSDIVVEKYKKIYASLIS